MWGEPASKAEWHQKFSMDWKAKATSKVTNRSHPWPCSQEIVDENEIANKHIYMMKNMVFKNWINQR